ncbi:MAG: outer membrane protein assembly factor BamD [Kiritimatiellae bacterium]|nr:outer membrane protein assembly factor BamD [Kiritimatiellia bacterium]
MRKIGLLFAVCACVAAQAAEPHRGVAGSSFAANSPYATDAYPGFDGLDDLKRPEKKDKSWFNWVDRATPAEQYELAKELEAASSFRKARRACDALVREWPAAAEAPHAQLRIVKIYAHEKDYDDALEELEYLLDFYPSEVPYLELVEYLYKLTNLMVKEKKTMFGLSFTSDRVVRQHYESVVRRAPRASYVPETMLKIADLREQNDEYEEAVQVYNQLIMKFPKTAEAEAAVYLQAKARMWLCRRLSYNIPRCVDTQKYLKMMIADHPRHDRVDEMKEWLAELERHLEADAYRRAKFYDSKQRTPHAAAAAWERFLREYPLSPHADEIRARIETLQKGIQQ